MAGYFDDVPDAPKGGGYFDDVPDVVPPEDQKRGIQERMAAGWEAGYHPILKDAVTQVAPDWSKEYPTAARIAQGFIDWSPLGMADRAFFGTLPAAANAATGIVAGAAEQSPTVAGMIPGEHFLESTPRTLSKAEADRLQRDLGIGVTGLMTEPGLGMAGQAAHARANSQLARRAQGLPDAPTPAEEAEFRQREQATRPPPPPPPPPRPGEPPFQQGQRGPGWKEAMDRQAQWREEFDAGRTPNEMWEPPPNSTSNFGEIRNENGAWNIYHDGAFQGSFASRAEAADGLRAKGFGEPRPSYASQQPPPGAGAGPGPEPPPGAGPEPGPEPGPRPGAGPEPGPEPPPGSGEWAGAKPRQETWEPSGAARFMGNLSGEIRQEGFERYSVYLNGNRFASFKTRDEAAATLRQYGFMEPGAAGAGPQPGPQPGPKPQQPPPPPPPEPPPQPEQPRAQAPPPPPEQPPTAEAFTPPRAAPRPPPEPPPRAPPPEAVRPAEPPPRPAPEQPRAPEPPAAEQPRAAPAPERPSYFEDVPPAAREEPARPADEGVQRAMEEPAAEPPPEQPPQEAAPPPQPSRAERARRDIEANERAQQMAREGPGEVPEPKGPLSPEAQEAIQIAKRMEAIGKPETEGFARAMRNAVAKGIFQPNSLEFYRQKLKDFQARAEGTAAREKPAEDYSIRTFLEPKELDAFTDAIRDRRYTQRAELADLLQRVEARTRELGKQINDAGWKVGDVRGGAQNLPPEIAALKQQLMEGMGQVIRTLADLKPRKLRKGPRNVPKLLEENKAKLREWLGEEAEPVPSEESRAAKAPPPKPEKRQSLLEFIAMNGGISSADPMIADLRSVLGRPNAMVPRYGALIRPTGRLLDRALENAVEAGYIEDPGWNQPNVPRTTTIRDLLDAIAEERAGRKVYPKGQEEAPRRPADDQRLQQQVERNVKQILSELEEGGLTKADIDMESVQDAAKAAINSNEGLVDLYERAVMAKADRDAQQAGAGGEGEGVAGAREQAARPRGEAEAPVEGEAGEGAGKVRQAGGPGEIDTPAIRQGVGPQAFGPTDIHTVNEVSDADLKYFQLRFYKRTGKFMTPIRSMSLRQAIKELNLNALEGVTHGIAKVFGKRLADVVGDVPVHIISEKEMHQYFKLKPGIEGSVGGFHNVKIGGTDTRQFIAINAADLLDPREHAESVLHEGMHAAALGAIQNNPEFKYAIYLLLNEARRVIKNPEKVYALSTEHEFLSESISNRRLQKVLATIKAPARAIPFTMGPVQTKGKFRTLWDSMVTAVRKATGFGPKFESLLDQILKVGEHITRSPEHPTNNLGMENPFVDTMSTPVRRGAGEEFDFNKPAPEPPKAKDDSRKSDQRQEFEKAQQDYRARRIGDEEYLKARKKYDAYTEELGADNKPQTVMPGAERDVGGMLQRKAEAPLKGKVAQKGTDFGLFGDESKQADMFSGKKPPEDIDMPIFRSKNYQQRQARARRNSLRRLEESYKEHFDPGRMSNESLMAEPMFGRRNARIAQAQDQLYREGDRRRKAWNAVPEDRQIQFMHDMETGMPVERAFQGIVADPHAQAPRGLVPFSTRPLRGAADVYRKLLNEAYMQEQMWGSKARYFEDYWPHIWEKPEDYVRFMENTHGSTWFQKQRTFELIEDGLAAGFKLKTTNPEDLIRMRLMAGADMRHTMQLLYELNGLRLAENVRTMGPTVAGSLAKGGWQEIVAPDRTKWMISPDIQPLWKNAVKAKGMWADQGAMGGWFRGWMGFKNIWVPLRLALSAFHLLHVAGINQASHWASALDQLARGRVIGAGASIGRGISPYQGRGRKGRNAWLKDVSNRTPREQEMVELMHDGGFSPMLSEPLRIDASKRLSDAIREGSPWKLPFQFPYHFMRQVIQKAQSGLFEHWIPHLKTAAYLADAAALLRRNPQWANVQRGSPDAHRRGVALTAIRKSIDNRFGEMFYSNLFWNRYAKDVSIGAFLSLGWNLGFAREFIGGPAEIPARMLAGARITKPSEARKIIRDSTNKIKFVGLYLAQGAFIAALISMFLGGKKSDELETMDYIFPAAGGKNPDGSDRRFNTMWYNREIPMVLKHVQEYGGGVTGWGLGLRDVLYGKLLLDPVIQIVRNRNYWGQEISDPEASAYKQLEQILKHVVTTQLTPMSATGAARAKETGGGTRDEWMAYLGFGPAPSYAAKTATQNRIAHLYKEYAAPGKRPYQEPEEVEATNKARTALMKAIQSGDKDEIRDAVSGAREAGLSKQYIDKRLKGESSTDTMFRRLPPQHQVGVVERAPADEREHYQKFMSKKAKALWEDKHGKFADGGYVNGDQEEEPVDEAAQKQAQQKTYQGFKVVPPPRQGDLNVRSVPGIAEGQYDPTARDTTNAWAAPRVGGFYTVPPDAKLNAKGQRMGEWRFSPQEVSRPQETPLVRRLPPQPLPPIPPAQELTPEQRDAILMRGYWESLAPKNWDKGGYRIYAEGGLVGKPGEIGDAAGIFSNNRTIDAIEQMHRNRKLAQGQYDTQLPPDQEQGFRQWKAQHAPRDSGEDYDLRGAYKAGVTPDPESGHMPDTFKKPNHPTFSDQSRYATGADQKRAGRWEGETYIPPKLARGGTALSSRELGEEDRYGAPTPEPIGPVWDLQRESRELKERKGTPPDFKMPGRAKGGLVR